VDEATQLLNEVGIATFPFHDFDENPDSAMIEAGRLVAAEQDIDSILALGGGSSLDTAKGINFVLTNGGTMRDYWGHDKVSGKPDSNPMLPMMGIPTTAGTGSEAQTYALISDAETHVKMACGDAQAAFKVTILDPRLTITQPAQLTATAGYDAIAHAVESFVTLKRNPISDVFAKEAWRLLATNYERVLAEPYNLEARGAMLLGAHYAGIAIENSMLGATHACANPLTAQYGTAHGVAIAVMLSHVVRWNADTVGARYAELAQVIGLSSAEQLAERLAQLAHAGGLPRSLSALEIPPADLPRLAEAASKQWTGTFNPRPFSAAGAKELYEWAY
jgi:alcohol dehydrogenase